MVLFPPTSTYPLQKALKCHPKILRGTLSIIMQLVPISAYHPSLPIDLNSPFYWCIPQNTKIPDVAFVISGHRLSLCWHTHARTHRPVAKWLNSCKTPILRFVTYSAQFWGESHKMKCSHLGNSATRQLGGNRYQPDFQTETEGIQSFISLWWKSSWSWWSWWQCTEASSSSLLNCGIIIIAHHHHHHHCTVASNLLWNWSEICVSICCCPADAHYNCTLFVIFCILFCRYFCFFLHFVFDCLF